MSDLVTFARGSGGRSPAVALLRGRRRGASLRPRRGPPAPLDAAVVPAHPGAGGRARACTLFERTSRRVVLTAAGERLLVEAREVLRSMDRFDTVARELASASSAATLSIGYCHGSEGGVMRAIGTFRAEHPDVAVRPNALTTLHILDGLRSGRLVRRHRAGPDHRPGPRRVRAAGPRARRPRVAAAAPPAGDGAVVDARDLDGEPVLRGRPERTRPTAHDEIEAYCAAVGSRPALGDPSGHAGGAGARPRRRGRGHRLAQRLAGRAGGRPHRRGRPAPGAGRPVRRVPGGLAGRRLGHADRRIRARRARDVRGLSGLGRADVGVHALVRRAVGVAELDGRHPFLGGPVSRPAAGARGTPDSAETSSAASMSPASR